MASAITGDGQTIIVEHLCRLTFPNIAKMSLHYRFSPKMNRSAIFWAVSSQMIWLPLLFMDSQDRLISKHRDYDFRSIVKLPHQNLPTELRDLGKTLASGTSKYQTHFTTDKSNVGILLNNSSHYIKGSARNDFKRDSSYSQPPKTFNYSSILPSPSANTLTAKSSVVSTGPLRYSFTAPSTIRSTIPVIRQLFSRSELLGGTVTLKDLDEPAIPPLARAERARWSRSGDPLAPLPDIWREPMRRALSILTNDAPLKTDQGPSNPSLDQSIDAARIIHVPSLTVRRSTQVPLALQADGTVDILNQPDDPAVVDEIKRWSFRQKPPAPGRVSPAVVHLHAFPEETNRKIDRPKQPLTSNFGNSSSKASDFPNRSLLPISSPPTEQFKPVTTRVASPVPPSSTTAPIPSQPAASSQASDSPQAAEAKTAPATPVPEAPAPTPAEVSVQPVVNPVNTTQSAEVAP